MTATRSESIRDLLAMPGPCITIVTSAAALPDAIEHVRQILSETERHPDALLEPMLDAGQKLAADRKGRGAVAILRAPDFLRVVPVGSDLKPVTRVGDRFDLRTLLEVEAAEATFHILALSQKRTRLLECTQQSSCEIAFSADFAQSLADFKQTDKPDHDLNNRSSAGPDVGGMKGVMFGTTTDREKKDDYLLHFFSAINRAVHTLLRDQSTPLIVAGVESELALYHRVNTYRFTLEPGVHGSPDAMDGTELHSKARDLVRSTPPRAALEALAEYDKKVGTGHASSHIHEIVQAAFEGRVSHFFFQEDAKYEGTYDTMRQRVKHSDPNDLIEAAASETIRHGGEARILAASSMPNGVPVCAVFRYAAAHA